MRTNRLLLAATILSVVGIVLASEDEKDIRQISPYRSWIQVTPKPLQIDFGSIAG
jgi:hypothetical protein